MDHRSVLVCRRNQLNLNHANIKPKLLIIKYYLYNNANPHNAGDDLQGRVPYLEQSPAQAYAYAHNRQHLRQGQERYHN